MINKARREKWSWNKTRKALEELGKHKSTSEATDSAVEESVYDRLGFEE